MTAKANIASAHLAIIGKSLGVGNNNIVISTIKLMIIQIGLKAFSLHFLTSTTAPIYCLLFYFPK